jgi:hypothetical protein
MSDKIKLLPFHKRLTDLFPAMTEREFDDLVGDINVHTQRNPIDIWNGEIIDGKHRALACQKLGIEPKYQERRFKDEAGARDYVLSQNMTRRHLTSAQKDEIIARLLKADPTKSDRAIAEQTKTNHHRVAKVRKREEGRGKISHVEKRKDSKGRSQPAKKAAKRSTSPSKPEPEQPMPGSIGPMLPAGALTTNPIDRDDDDGDSPEVIWRRGLAHRARESAGHALYEDWSNFTADDELVELARKAEKAWKATAEYLVKLRAPHETASLTEAVKGAFDDLAELAEECREVVDNAPPGISETQRIQTLDETASTLEGLEAPDVPDELAECKVLYETRKIRSRSDRREAACLVIEGCVSMLDGLDEKHPSHAKACELAEALGEASSEVEYLDFPGMCG